MDIIVTKRVRSQQKARCTNSECGSTKLFHWRSNAHYAAHKCHECGQFVVEGNVDLFTVHESNLNHQAIGAQIKDEAGALLEEIRTGQ